MAVRGWRGSYQNTTLSWVLESRTGLTSSATSNCSRTAQQPSRRSLFQASTPQQRQPQKGKPSGSTPSPSASRSSTSPARLPYKSTSPTASSSSSPSDKSNQQQKNGQKEEPETLESLFSQRKLPLVGAALAAGVLGFYILPLLVTYMTGGCREEHKHEEEIPPDAVPTGLPPMGAAAFDASLDMPERIMGILSQRKKLARASHGAVLEVAVGTGRNVGYYLWDPQSFSPDYIRASAIASGQAIAPEGTTITSFTGIDLSGDALSIARTQLRVTIPAVAAVIPKKTPAIGNSASGRTTEVFNVLDNKVRLFQGDAMQPLPAPALSTASPYYDTIVQTFGLCSVADPVVLLANMAAVLKPETGRIVLLEHGRGWWSVVNSLLDKYAGRHFARFGCWWNRDMDAIVADAQKAVPGLEVVSVKRPGWLQFGTLWWIELRVKGASEKK
ncbi:hypothetical protein SEUCBS140593_003770 [Sporothrix eucalyptigena]|uniref:Ubiquinone/menaquinone biosynthesis-related protein n=1 Tax=Sporothrix eucalyptigena TaxID=1812306 RepID=A0ABP0BHI0_9PEZI